LIHEREVLKAFGREQFLVVQHFHDCITVDVAHQVVAILLIKPKEVVEEFCPGEVDFGDNNAVVFAALELPEQRNDIIDADAVVLIDMNAEVP
jgi:hypothetical protein